MFDVPQSLAREKLRAFFDVVGIVHVVHETDIQENNLGVIETHAVSYLLPNLSPESV